MRRGSPSGQAARLLLATALLALGLWIPTPAQAADPESWLSVRIEGMSPAVPERDGTVRLSGTVRNTSDVTLTRLQALLWRSLDPITDREGMDQALTSRANEPLGSRVKPQEINENIPSDDDRTLAPGESTEFDLTADVEDFDLPADDGVYLIGVQIRGRVDGGGDDEILGRGRVFMPLIAPVEKPADRPSDGVAAQQLTSVVLLNSRPSLVRTGVLVDDHLNQEVTAGGRLRVLLDAAKQPGVTYAVDPAMISELETMRRGYQVLGPDDSVRTGNGSEAAARWLDDFERLRARADGYRTLFGSPDLTALIRANVQQVITESKEAGEEVEATRGLPLLVLPGAGRADGDTMAAAGTLGANVILVSQNTAKGDSPLLGVGGATPVVTYDPVVLTGGPGPSPRRTPVKLRQRALAESWIAAAHASADRPARQVRLITNEDQAATVPAGATPWLQPRTLTRLLEETPAPFDDSFAFGSRARAAELSDGQLATIAELRERYTTYVDLFVDSDRAAGQRRAVVPRAASNLWRGQQDAFTRYTDAVAAEVDDAIDEISIVVTPRVQTTGRSAAFPITVRNRLPASDTDPQVNAIRVELRFTSVNSQRLTVEPIEIATLAADSGRTENAQVRAQTNGSVAVTARLFTATGRPLGTSERILVNATQAGTVGWIIAVVAGVVLVGTTALRIRQVAKERSAEAEPPSDESTDPTEPAPLPVSRPAVVQTEAPPPAPEKDRDPLDV